MKKVLFLFFFLQTMFFTYAQVPQSMTYQAVATNANGQELVEQEINLKASILKGTASGTVEWIETHLVTTDNFGLFTINIGEGTPAGGSQSTFGNMKWGDDKYFLKIEMDIAGGNNFILMGVSQFRSVPYALYAEKSGSSVYSDTSNVANTANYADQSTHADYADTSTYADIANTAITATDDYDKDPSNELQSLVFQNGILNVSPALPGSNGIAIQDDDSDPENEIQTLSFDNNTGDLSISGNTGNLVNIYDGVFNRPGGSLEFPQGILGTYRYIKPANNYFVPTGKTFYITASGTSNGVMSFSKPGFAVVEELCTYPTGPIFPSGSKLVDCNCTGFEIDNVSFITPVIIDLETPFLIPPGKVLFIKSGLKIGPNTLKVDGELTGFYVPNNGSKIPTIPGGTNGMIIENPVGAPPVLTGYLLDEPQ